MKVQLMSVFAAMAFGAAFAAKVTEVGVTSRSMGKDVPVSIVLPDKYFRDPGAEWTPVASYAVDDRPSEGVMEIVERPLPEGRESRIVVTYDRDTAALKKVRR